MIKYTPHGTDSMQVFKTTTHSAGPNEDLVLALKLPGPVDNSIFIISSWRSMGASDIADYPANPKYVWILKKNFSRDLKKFRNTLNFYSV